QDIPLIYRGNALSRHVNQSSGNPECSKGNFKARWFYDFRKKGLGENGKI
ncbi:hypothetical protein Gotri_027484, partial [Gossypium trilobum]|nr:hypothetical protein [Gossypium trilobum]